MPNLIEWAPFVRYKRNREKWKNGCMLIDQPHPKTTRATSPLSKAQIDRETNDDDDEDDDFDARNGPARYLIIKFAQQAEAAEKLLTNLNIYNYFVLLSALRSFTSVRKWCLLERCLRPEKPAQRPNNVLGRGKLDVLTFCTSFYNLYIKSGTFEGSPA